MYLVTSVAVNAQIRYVKPGGIGAGSSWADASGDLQAMINASPPGGEVWVAAGIYYADEGAGQTNNDRNAAYTLKNGVTVYGGFPATGSPIMINRDWTTNVTTLSGDIDKNDGANYGNRSGNAYNIVRNAFNGLNNSAILDGFVLYGANANGTTVNQQTGGGMLNMNSSPAVRNCKFLENQSIGSNAGGGVYDQVNASRFENCQFSGNISVSFFGSAYAGLFTKTIFVNCLFSGNQSTGGGSAVYLQGDNGGINPTLINCTVAGNRNAGIHSNSTPAISNCIVWGNGGTAVMGSAVFTNSLIQGANPGGSNLNGTLLSNNPLFFNQISAASAPTTAGDYRLQPASPAIDAGDNAFLAGITTDLYGNTRQLGTVDMGVYEAPCKAKGDPTVFGNNVWNVYAWNKGNFNNNAGENWNTFYSGYYTTNSLNFNSNNDFNNGASPSSAPNYQGCPVNNDFHSWSAKRQDFPCGYYQLNIPTHDDQVQVWINGNMVFEHIGCCDGHNNVWTGWLGTNDKIEFRVTEGNNASQGLLNFVPITNLTCPGPQTANTANGVCNAVVNYNVTVGGTPPPALVYQFSGATTGSGSGTGSGSTFNKGVTNVTVKTNNGCGDLQCSFTVTVNDNQPPAISCPPPATVECGASTLPAGTGTATATDNCTAPGSIVITYTDVVVYNPTPSNSTYYYKINRTWKATDQSNLSSTCTQVITVTDVTAPVKTCPHDITGNGAL